MIPRPRRSGFTLVELLVAVAIFGVMVMGLSYFYSMVFGRQYSQFADLAAANGATLARRAFDSAMGSATYIQAPSIGAAATSLTVWSNFDVDSGAPLVAGSPQFSYLCLDSAGQNVYLYQGSGTPASWSPPTSCGTSISNVTPTLLAGGSGFANTLQFYRPYELNQSAVTASAEPNLVQNPCEDHCFEDCSRGVSFVAAAVR